jgi:hypothetical protein
VDVVEMTETHASVVEAPGLVTGPEEAVVLAVVLDSAIAPGMGVAAVVGLETTTLGQEVAMEATPAEAAAAATSVEIRVVKQKALETLQKALATQLKDLATQVAPQKVLETPAVVVGPF